jgi:hypothetical protein
MSDMNTPDEHLAAARAILAKVRERGGVENVGHLDAHGAVRQALGVETTDPATWQATRAALDAIYAGASDPAAVAKAVAAAHTKPDETYPASLYGAGEPSGPSDGGVNKPSQWMSPERRKALLRASRLGRAVVNHKTHDS